MSIYVGFVLLKPIKSKKRYKYFITELEQHIELHKKEVNYR